MPSSNVNWPLPLTRQNPWFPGQMGVPGTDTETGLRLHSTGCVFYVDPNYPGASDLRDGTNPEDPLLTVQAAINKCQPYRGDVVAVMCNNAWQYHNNADGYLTPIAEEVVISVPGVRLVGVNPSGSNGVPWLATDDNQTLIHIKALDVCVEGFLFYDDNNAGIRGIFAEWGVLAFGDNPTIRNNTFHGLAIGVQLEYCWYAHIHDNIFHDGKGIYVDPALSGAAYNDIHDNQFDYCAFAMSCQGMDYSFIHGNSLSDWRAITGAAATDAGIDLTNGNRNQVYDNYLSCLLPAAAPGDYNDYNTAGATDAWIGNHCMDGLAVTRPT